MNQFEKLKQFTGAIEEDVRGENEKIMTEVQREAESVMSAAEDEILDDAFRFIKNEVARERTDMGRMISRRMMENKKKLNARREEMGEVIMEKVVTRLEEYVKTDAYAMSLVETVRKILIKFEHANTVLYLRKNDLQFEEVLRSSLLDEVFDVKEGSFEMGGVMGECPVTHMQIDASYDTKFRDLRGHFAEMFGLQLSQ